MRPLLLLCAFLSIFSSAFAQFTLTVTVNASVKTYGQDNPTFTCSYSGWAPGDGTQILTSFPTFTTTATPGSPVGNYQVTASGVFAADDLYTYVYVPGTLKVNAAPLTITPNNVTGGFDDPLPTFTASYTGFVNGDDASSLTQGPSFSTTATSTSAEGNYPINASGASATNYTISYGQGTLTIGKPILTITVNSTSKVYGAGLPSLSVSYSGFENGDGPGSLTTPPTISTTATTGSPVGAYPISASGAVDPNYNIVYVDGSLTVSPAPLTITASDASMIYGSGSLPTFSVSYSGFVNGEAASVLETAPTVTTTATARSGANSYTLTPSGASAANYSITYVNGTLKIGKAPLTISITPGQVFTYGQEVIALLGVTYTGLVNGDLPSAVFVSGLSFDGPFVPPWVLTVPRCPQRLPPIIRSPFPLEQ